MKQLSQGGTANKFKILVVDDEVKITEAVASYLKAYGYEPLVCHNGKRALEVARLESVDLALLDWMLPDISGIELCQIVRHELTLPVIMMTALSDEDRILEGFACGADDYVTKPFSMKQLMARISAVLNRSKLSKVEGHSLVVDEGRLVLDWESHSVLKDGQEVALTPNEFELVFLMAKHSHKVFTREELILQALGADYDGFDRVIDTHVKNIRQKIEDDPKQPRYILTIHGVGYRFGGK